MIRVEHLSVSYGETNVLKDLSFEISTGEFVLLTGPSGCGKSTLARTLCGLIPHALPAQMRGSVTVAGMDTQAHPLPDLAQRVGMVFQNPATQLFHIKVAEEVAFGPRNLGLPEDEVQARTEWALQATGLGDMQACKSAELSGGQKQCLAIAAALAMRPQVLILDEPTASLDLVNSRKVLETLSRLREELGVTILIIEHRFAILVRRVDRAIIMDAGRIIADGEPGIVLMDGAISRSLGLRRLANQSPKRWQSLVRPNGHRQVNTTPLLKLENITAGYGYKPVIQNVNLEIYPGDFVALVGNNGAGKSTVARVAAGLIKPMNGKVCFSGGDRPRPGLDVSLVFQNPSEQLFTEHVEEEIAFGLWNYNAYDQQAFIEVLQEADLLGLRTRKISTLSMGQQQRTVLAACLALRPKLLILDEPTLGQDWGHMQRLMDYIVRLNRMGITILLISHDYKLVYHYAQRVLIMDKGKISIEGKWIDKAD